MRTLRRSRSLRQKRKGGSRKYRQVGGEIVKLNIYQLFGKPVLDYEFDTEKTLKEFIKECIRLEIFEIPKSYKNTHPTMRLTYIPDDLPFHNYMVILKKKNFNGEDESVLLKDLDKKLVDYGVESQSILGCTMTR